MSKPPLGARKDEKWYAMGIEPSITKTPIGPIQVPVPYQVISDLSQSTATSDSVFLNGQPAYLLDQSKMPKCMGDEQGTSGGSRSGTTSQETKPTSGSDSLSFNGKKAVRHGDKCTLNRENCKGQYLAMPPVAALTKARSRLAIKCSKVEACSNDVLDVEATGIQEIGDYQWEHSRNCYLVDDSNKRSIKGKKLKLVIKDDSLEASPEPYATVAVRFQSSKGDYYAKKRIKIHEGQGIHKIFEWFRSCAGNSSDLVTEHYTTHINSEGVTIEGPINDFDFSQVPLALVVIPGMNLHSVGVRDQDLKSDPAIQRFQHTPIDEAEAMYTACNLSFKVKQSALIYNYTQIAHLGAKGYITTKLFPPAILASKLYKEFEKQLGIPELPDGDYSTDALRSLYYEIFGAQDALVNATVLAILSGLKEKKEVYVVAHDQGAEIFKIALAKIMCGPVHQEYFGKIYYQGFGPETNIDRESSLYLGYARNVKIKEDSIPTKWTTIKYGIGLYKCGMALASLPEIGIEKAEYPILRGIQELLFTNHHLVTILRRAFLWKAVQMGISNIENVADSWKEELKGEHSDKSKFFERPSRFLTRQIKRLAELMLGKDLVRLPQQQWEVVDTPLPIHYKEVWKGEHQYYLCDKNKHDHVHGFLKAYWAYLKVPINGKSIPKENVFPVDSKGRLAQTLPKKMLEVEKSNAPSPGMQVTKATHANEGAPADPKQQVILAYFVDGLSFYMKQTNIDAMRKALFDARKDLPTTVSVWTVQDPGPGRNSLSPAQEELGDESMDITKSIYQSVCKEYDAYYSEGYKNISIDLYGFSRGAAIANEVAWMIDVDNIQLEDRETIIPKRSMKVRFLGLFDTVHAMGNDGPNRTQRWHNRTIAPCVQHAAHALARNETRIFFAPTVFETLQGSSTQLIQNQFPGIHTDVGGGLENNPLIAKLTLSWMAQHAAQAQVSYLRALVLSPEVEQELKNNPEIFKSGKESYPNQDYVDNGGLFFWERGSMDGADWAGIPIQSLQKDRNVRAVRDLETVKRNI